MGNSSNPDQIPQDYTAQALNYIQQNAAMINSVAAALGVSAASIADAIAREMTRSTFANTIVQDGHSIIEDSTELYTNEAWDGFLQAEQQMQSIDPNIFNNPTTS